VSVVAQSWAKKWRFTCNLPVCWTLFLTHLSNTSTGKHTVQGIICTSHSRDMKCMSQDDVNMKCNAQHWLRWFSIRYQDGCDLNTISESIFGGFQWHVEGAGSYKNGRHVALALTFPPRARSPTNRLHARATGSSGEVPPVADKGILTSMAERCRLQTSVG
jgi:hypothetical protein